MRAAVPVMRHQGPGCALPQSCAGSPRLLPALRLCLPAPAQDHLLSPAGHVPDVCDNCGAEAAEAACLHHSFSCCTWTVLGVSKMKPPATLAFLICTLVPGARLSSFRAGVWFSSKPLQLVLPSVRRSVSRLRQERLVQFSGCLLSLEACRTGRTSPFHCLHRQAVACTRPLQRSLAAPGAPSALCLLPAGLQE